MTNVETSYFFPPQWNYQVGGTIALGSIIANPKHPQSSLNDEDVPGYHAPNLPRLVVDHPKPNFEAKVTDNTQVSASIGTSLLQLFGFGVDVKAALGRTLVYRIEAKNLLTQEIDPKPTYVEACFKHPEVDRVLRESKFRKDLYMIVGIMSVTDATVSCDIGRKCLFEGKAALDLTAATGAPLGMHAQAGHEKEKGTVASFGLSNFILAYRLRKITFMKGSRLKKMEDEVKGAVLGKGHTAPAAERIEYAVFERLEEERIGADEFELESVTAYIDGENEQLELVVPYNR